MANRQWFATIEAMQAPRSRTMEYPLRRPGGRTEGTRFAVAAAVLSLLKDATPFSPKRLQNKMHAVDQIHERLPTRRTAPRLQTAGFFSSPLEMSMNIAFASSDDIESRSHAFTHWTTYVKTL